MDNLSNLPPRSLQSISSFSKSPKMPEMTAELPEKSVKRIEEPAISLKKIAQLEADLEEIKKDKEAEMSRLATNMVQIEASLKIVKLEADLVDERERNRDLERKIAETKRKNDDLEAQFSDPNTEVRDGKVTIGELEGKINALQSKDSDLETKIECEQKERSDEFTKINSKFSQSDDRSMKIGAELKEIDSKVAEMSRAIYMKMARIEANLMGKITQLEAALQLERKNKRVEIAKLQADLNRTMTFLDLDGWSYLAKTASWYKVIDREMTFDEAEAYCASRKGHLVTIHSHEENDLVQKLAKTVDSDRFWIGSKKNPKKGNTFEWTDGSPVDFTNWYPGEPDSNTHAYLWSLDGKWKAWDPTKGFFFICKKSSH